MSDRKIRKDKITFSPEQIEMMERLAGLGLTVVQICSILGVSHQTLYRRISEDGGDEISETLHRGKAVALSKVAEKAFELALEGDSNMIRYILSSKGGWAPNSQISSTVTIEGGQNPISLSHITEDQIKRMAEKYLERGDSDE